MVRLWTEGHLTTVDDVNALMGGRGGLVDGLAKEIVDGGVWGSFGSGGDGAGLLVAARDGVSQVVVGVELLGMGRVGGERICSNQRIAQEGARSVGERS